MDGANTNEGLPQHAGREATYYNRPLVPTSIVPPEVPDPNVEENQRRRDYVLEGLEKNYSLLDDHHDRRIFKTSTPLDNFLHNGQKYMTPEELEEATKPKYYGDLRYKPGAEETITTAALVSTPAIPLEPAPSVAAPAAADSSSDSEEEVLQVLVADDSDEELTGVAAALARSAVRAKQLIPAPPSGRGTGRGATRGCEGRGRGATRGREGR